jgi:sulfate adenylyltransferase subunit 1
MDLVDYDEATYEQIKSDYKAFAAQLNISKIDFIPLSALKGDNVVNPSENMNWYKGPALLPFLEEVEQTIDQIADGFQLPVQYVNRPNADFRGYCGTLNRGSVAPGDSITVLPSGLTTTVERVIGANGDVDRADSGMAITLTLEDEIDVSRGDMLVRPHQKPHSADSFEADVVWMTEEALHVDREYEIKVGSKSVYGYAETINYKVDVNTLEQQEASQLNLNEIGNCQFSATRLFHNCNYSSFLVPKKYSLIWGSTSISLAGAVWTTFPLEKIYPLSERDNDNLAFCSTIRTVIPFSRSASILSIICC